MAKRIALLVLTVTIAACGGSQTQSGQPGGRLSDADYSAAMERAARFVEPGSQSASAITLTNSDCTSEGLSGVLERAFVVAVVNMTSSKVVFNLHRLLDGRGYRELELHIQQRHQAIAAGNDTPVLPPMTVHVAGVMVEPGQRGKLEGALSSGTYGIVCRRDAPTGRSEAIYVKGPFQVD